MVAAAVLDGGQRGQILEHHFFRDSTRRQRSVLILDPRRYRRRGGHLLYADRVLLGSLWTPFVRVRVRYPRASEGGTEI